MSKRTQQKPRANLVDPAAMALVAHRAEMASADWEKLPGMSARSADPFGSDVSWNELFEEEMGKRNDSWKAFVGSTLSHEELHEGILDSIGNYGYDFAVWTKDWIYFASADGRGRANLQSKPREEVIETWSFRATN